MKKRKRKEWNDKGSNRIFLCIAPDLVKGDNASGSFKLKTNEPSRLDIILDSVNSIKRIDPVTRCIDIEGTNLYRKQAINRKLLPYLIPEEAKSYLKVRVDDQGLQSYDYIIPKPQTNSKP